MSLYLSWGHLEVIVITGITMRTYRIPKRNTNQLFAGKIKGF